MVRLVSSKEKRMMSVYDLECDRQRAILYELYMLELGGCTILREYTMDDSLDEMEAYLVLMRQKAKKKPE
jgi:hypothetical protein